MVDIEKKIQEGLDSQLKFNNDTNGECWLDGVTKEGKNIDWMLCTAMELSEAIESMPWKHWKNISGNADIQNVKMELTDAWHFLLSEALHREHILNGSCSAIKELSPSDKSVLIGQELAKVMYTSDCKDPELVLTKMLSSTLKQTDSFIKTLICFYAVMTIMEEQYEFGLKEMFDMYILKNALNIIRQKHGYKTGDYVKMWTAYDSNGDDFEEDNVWCMRYQDQHPGLTLEEFVEVIDTKYKDMIYVNITEVNEKEKVTYPRVVNGELEITSIDYLYRDDPVEE